MIILHGINGFEAHCHLDLTEEHGRKVASVVRDDGVRVGTWFADDLTGLDSLQLPGGGWLEFRADEDDDTWTCPRCHGQRVEYDAQEKAIGACVVCVSREPSALEFVLERVLETHSGLSMDSSEDREALLTALVPAVLWVDCYFA